MKLKGKLSISASSGQLDDNRQFRIEITDESSRIRFCTVTISGSELVNALSTLADRPCEIETRGLDLIGKIRENKTEFVPAIPEYKNKDRKIHAAEALKPFLVEGWEAREGDFGNHHNGSDDKGYRVVFFRLVDRS